MTCLVAWLAKDSNGPSSAYIASDSLITWTAPNVEKAPIGGSWIHASKVIASAKRPVIAGYCGESIFGTTTLVQLMAMIDAGDEPISYETTMSAAAEILGASHAAYPFPIRASFILGMRPSATEFVFVSIKCEPQKPPDIEQLVADDGTGLFGSWGSGRDAYMTEHRKWQRSDAAGYSRAIACAFFDAVGSGADERTGGPPQIVGLYRKGPAVVHGIVTESGRSVLGMEIPTSTLRAISCPVQWRNSNFERCDPETMAPLKGAQPQPRPSNVG